MRINERLHYMDLMRATLMILGIVLHSAQVYSPNIGIIRSSDPEPIMGHLVSFIHSFRMHAFFIVSGFFCYLTLQRYDIKKFLNIRIRRLVVPLLTTAVTLNSIMAFLLAHTGWMDFDFVQYITTGKYVEHTWFLIDLTLFFLAAAFVAAFFKKSAAFFGMMITRALLFMPTVVVILLLPLISIGFHALGKIGFPFYANFFNIIVVPDLCNYLPYFVFGMLLSYKPELLSRFCSGKTTCLLLLAALAAKMMPLPSDGLVFDVAEVWYPCFYAWVGSAVCFYIFRKFLNNASNLSLFLSDASYTVYLFHYVLVVLFGLVCIHFGISAFVAVPSMIIVIFTLTLLIHKYVILRFPLMRFLFNGK